MGGIDLREPGSILLVSCYELGRQPAGIASPAAFLRRAGYDPACVDTAVERLDAAAMRRARFAAISVPMHTALRLGERVAGRIRARNPDCRICFHGLYALLNAEHLVGAAADYVIGGECEEPLVRLVAALEAGEEPPRGVGRAGSPPSPWIRRLSYPVPDRSGLPPLREYAQLALGDARIPAGSVEASRGCKHLCRHCPIPPVYEGRFFAVPREVVLEDIRRQAAMGARHITFADPDFLNGPTHSLRIVRRMHSEFPDLTFDFTAKVEHLVRLRDLLPELGRLGCIFVVSAVESLSDTVLGHLDKGHTRADFFEALDAVRKAGIVLRPTLVSFTPWTTLGDYLEVLEVAESEDLLDCIDPIQYAIRLLIPPGSRLLSMPGTRSAIGEFNRDRFTWEWKHPDPRMDELHRRVTALVEDAVHRGEDALRTYRRIRELALRTNGDPAIPAGADLPAPTRAWRMTEPWFC